MRDNVLVRNISGTSSERYGTPPKEFISWRAYWEEMTGKEFSRCSNTLCSNEAEVGGHVQKVESWDKHWYIVPLCKACNNKRSSFEVNGDDLCPVRK